MTRHEATLIAGPIPDGWDFVPVRDVGFFTVKGSEIHCWRRPEASGRWLTRQDVERITRPLIARFGRVTTKVRKGNTAGHAFVHRLGFSKIGEADGCITYTAERMKHARL